MALLNSARYQQKLRRYPDKHIHKRDLNVGDLVLRQRQSNQGRRKLTPPWEGPYMVAEVLKPRTYRLTDEKGRSSPMHGTSNSYIASTPRASRLYISYAFCTIEAPRMNKRMCLGCQQGVSQPTLTTRGYINKSRPQLDVST